MPSISKKLKNVFIKAGFKVVFKSDKTLESILTNRNKPGLPKNNSPRCYRVPCGCGANYIGQTKKRITSRFKEHEKAIFKGNTSDSALSEHAVHCPNNIDWGNASTLTTETNYQNRCVREAFEI